MLPFSLIVAIAYIGVRIISIVLVSSKNCGKLYCQRNWFFKCLLEKRSCYLVTRYIYIRIHQEKSFGEINSEIISEMRNLPSCI